MSGIRPGIRRFFRIALRRDDLAAADVDREIEFHLEARVQQLVASGLSRRDAEAEAHRRFGDVDRARAELSASVVRRQAQLTLREHFYSLVADFQYVARALSRSRGFTAVVVATFALGIGANAVMFGVIDRLLFRGPDHVVQPDRLMRLYNSSPQQLVPGMGAATSADFGFVSYAMLRDQARTIEGAAAYTTSRVTTVRVNETSERIQVSQATWDLFALTGVKPALGRFMSRDEDHPPSPTRVAVIGYDLWHRVFAGDPAVIGKTIRMFGIEYTVRGVAPRGFTGAELAPVDLWIPIDRGPVMNWTSAWSAAWLRIVVRLRPDVTAEAAAAEVSALHKRNYDGADPAVAHALVLLRPISFGDAGREKPETAVARWLVGVSVVVLLVACANIANLLLARALSRRREIAVRLALGISIGRLWRLLLVEGLTLAITGCAAGLLLAWVGGSAIRKLMFADVAWTSAPVDGRVLAVAAAVALVSGLVVSIAPALQAARTCVANSLKSGTQQSGRERSLTRSGLLFLQCAFSVVLLVGAGLFLLSLHRVRGLDLGFRQNGVVRASINWRDVGPERGPGATGPRDITFVERLRATPGIQNAAAAIGTPFGSAFGVSLYVPGRDSIPNLGDGGPYISAVTPEYFATMGTRLVTGRYFTTADRGGSEPVVIVNDVMARTLWPNEDPLDKCLLIFSKDFPCARVVGVIGEMRRRALREAPAMQYFVPLGQERSIGGTSYMVLGTGSASATASLLQNMLRNDASVATVRAAPLQDAIDPLYRQWRLGAILFLVFGGLALGIAVVGLYSVIAYSVAQRVPEFGVRLALGATRANIVALVVRSGITVVIAGLTAGVAASLPAGRLVEGLLFETSARDPLVLVFVVVTLLLVAVAACLGPAYRAGRLDPSSALRAD